MEFDKVIKMRKSTRLFSKKEVDSEVLNKILESGRIAPSAKNLQPIKIYIVQSDEGLTKIDKASPCRYGSRCVLLICGNTKSHYYKEDCSIMATHMMLSATNEGVDNIWIGMFDENILKDEFNIPDDFEPVLLLPLGYKAKLCPPSPFHKKRKPIKELVEYC